MVLAAIFAFSGLLYAAPLDWLSYCRVQLGATDQQVSDFLGPPAGGWRSSRHIGGVTSPGSVAMPYAERGVPLDLVRQGKVYQSDDAQTVVIAPPATAVQQAGSPTVRMQQWWGSRHAIDVAFNERGQVVGVYLAWLRPVNWF